ncbi:hypothetical protein IE53DRAFT_137400 [Violaceomyces palustris]|uniref:Uncharacterized protein n=1 Tax=Violaceomyces palustris TaxID=1673888 RepID=A0ACD0P6P5_9BASI|nr:hypothetical protein IE53DRAFT_137400 [Violaceomyces palustris]
MASLFLFLLCLSLSVNVKPLLASPMASSAGNTHHLERRSSENDACQASLNSRPPLPETGYYNPLNASTGSMLSIVPEGETFGEPINAIISGKSSKSVLCPEGFLRWATSINFGVSCLGNANGTPQFADLGDGYGNRTQGTYDGQNGVLRWNYGDPILGTCKESFLGDNHFRWWIQNGTEGNSNAIFLAVSMEESAALGHKIQLDGYNRGRDYLVGNVTSYTNGSEWSGFRYNTTVEWVPAGVLLNATSDRINHPDVALPGQPVQDGRVAVLTVTQLASGQRSSSDASRPWSVHPHTLTLSSVVVSSLAFAFCLLA